MAVSAAFSIAIAVVAITLLSHKPRTAARSDTGSGVATQPRRNKQLDRSLSLNGYAPVGAKVIGRDPTLWYRTIVVDKGSQDGVALNDPVTGDGALVGRIASVHPTVAIVELITNPSFAVAVRVQDASGDTGVLVPKIGDPRELLLRDLPNHAQVAIGQQVITVHFSRGSLASLYPAGILIGRISSAKPNEKISHGDVPVTPAADIRHIAAVQILTPAKARSIPADLQHAFPAFRRPRVSADDLPSGYIRPAVRNGANPSLSRFLIATPAFQGGAPTKIWLIPARGGRLCDVEKQGSGGGFGCIADSVAVQGGLIRGIVGPNKAMLFGGLPQKTKNAKVVQANGLSHPIRLTPTGGFVVLSNLPATLSFIQPNGRLVTDPLQPAVPRPGQLKAKSCHHTTPSC
jgi:hypothetical protein